LPHLAGVVVERIEREDDRVWIEARPVARVARCPRCDDVSGRVHSRYERVLADAAVAGQRVVVRLRVRRFFCGNAECPASTFVEQVAGLTERHARRTSLLRRMLEDIGLALAGRAGARLAARLGMTVGRDSLLRLVRALPDPPVGEVTVLGVDDFAIRKGQVYATILLDQATHRPIDVLPDREADTLAQWLQAHPEVRIITRDRAGAYAEGATRGAPQATQCADRWHVWKNLGEAVEKTVRAHRHCLPDPAAEAEPSVNAALSADDLEGPPAAADPAQVLASDVESDSVTEVKPVVVHFRERYSAVQALRVEGNGIRAVARELGLDRKTARRFFNATSVEELLAASLSRTSVLDEYKPYLHQRFNAGCTDAAALTTEIREQGYRGSERTVYRYIQPFRASRKAPDPAPASPKIKHVTGWIMRNPENLPAEDEQRLKAILTRCPELAATRRHVGVFATMIRDLHGDRLPDWIDHVRTDNLPALHSFTTGLKQDQDAVTAGLTLTWSNGPTEGTVNKIKMIKRTMFGRAKLDLLRKRILLTT
jgi:transposase